MSSTKDPEACYFKQCPYEEIAGDDELRSILDFCSMVVEKYEATDKGTGRQTVKFSISRENFKFFARVYLIPPEKLREALEWASLVATAAQDAVRLRGRDESSLSLDLDDEE